MKNLILLSLVLSFSLHAQELPTQTKKEKFDFYRTTIESKLFGSLDNLGITPRALGRKTAKNWKKINTVIKKDLIVSKSMNNDSSEYKAEFDRLTNAKETYFSKAEVLINGPASFKKRKELIDSAEDSILFMSWAIYDDLTGKIHTDWLLEKLKTNPNIMIRVLVDGQIALQKNHFMELKRMERESKGKIQVVRWITNRYRGNGTHRKFFIVDQKKVIFGGINVGDYYSHMNPKVPGWRDTDIYFEGDIAQKSAELFQDIWNQQVDENDLKVDVMDLSPVMHFIGTPMSLIDHKPGDKTHKKADHNILMAYAKLIGDAKVSVDIENAYFIFNPIIKDAMTTALKRGVKVRVLTNSNESVDEPVVSVPILQSAQMALSMGAEVYLRKGTTLHSKFMVIDNKIAVIGSDNLHPRSQHFEGESMTVSFSSELAQKLTLAFENDFLEATKYEKASDIKIEKTFLSTLAKMLFFNHL